MGTDVCVQNSQKMEWCFLAPAAFRLNAILCLVPKCQLNTPDSAPTQTDSREKPTYSIWVINLVTLKVNAFSWIKIFIFVSNFAQVCS